MNNKHLPQEDKWTFRKVGTPFPPHAVKAHGQPNMYVALCYKHGKPFMGMAWNESGVVQCSFVTNDVVQEGKEVAGEIQLLTYTQSHNEVGFWYDWVPFPRWKSEEGSECFAVRCGQSIAVFLADKNSLGHMDLGTKKAYMQLGRKSFETLFESSPNMAKLLILCRITRGGPPHCPCATCAMSKVKNRPPLMVNDWADYKEGDLMPVDKPVCRALGRSLNTPIGAQDQFVALWYRHGKPVMGRAWCDGAKICASFVEGGREFTGINVGSLQLLIEIPAAAAGFDYCWLPYEQASKQEGEDFAPLHMDYMAPCVIQFGQFEVLGGVNLKMEVAEAAFQGKFFKFEGGALKHFMILCRKDRDDTMSI